MKISILVSIFFVVNIQLIKCAKILGIFPIAANSHYTLGNSLMRGLAEAGHDVTMISPHNDTVPTKKGSYRNVCLTGFAESYNDAMRKYNRFQQSDVNSFTFLLKFQKVSILLMEKIFRHPNVINLLNSGETFDVVIVEQITAEALKYFAYHFKGHLVLFSSIATDSKINYVVGNPTMVSYTPLVDTDFSPQMNFKQRIHNFLLYISEALIYKWIWLPQLDTLLQKHFPGAPSMLAINYNVSLVLVNSHESIQPSVPLVPNIVPIGGFHVKNAKALPSDLQKYLDAATDGVVYVSFGSSLRAEDLPQHKRDALIKSFGRIKSKVLWKWEGDPIDNLPENVKTGKWFPQKDLLAHPNVKVFVTQGGLLSLTESIKNGVPLLVIPIFGDQAMNAQFVVTGGYGLTISFHDPNFSDETLVPLINELISDPKYKHNALKRSKLFHDRDVDPLQKAVFWIEHLIRFGGSHLKVWGVKLPWYQHYSLDVVSLLLCLVCLLVTCFVNIVKYVIRLIISLTTKSNKSVNKKKSDGNRKLKTK